MDNIFFDFDGTIINSQYRIYNLFCELCSENNFTYDQYWEIKRNRINQKDFLQKYFNYSSEKCSEFKEMWLAKIEEENRLKEDFLLEGIENKLQKLSQKYNLVIVTNRQNKNLTIQEIKNLKIEKYFKEILVTEQKKSKVELIKSYGYSPEDVLIGDTGEDIKTAKELGIKSCAVCWGIMNKKTISEYTPDIILDDIKELEMF